MASAPDPELIVKQIEPGDRLTGLRLGDVIYAPLKTFIQRHAHEYERQSLARTYAAFEGTSVRGYITLVCGEVVTGDGDGPLVEDVGLKYLYKQYPAVKIARLAVDARLRKQDLGRTLVKIALGVAADTICPAVGCRFVMVDSKKPAVTFYEKCGFTMLDTEANRNREEPVMFVDLKKTIPA